MNPEADPKAIDFEAEMDNLLHYDENLSVLSMKYPMFNWPGSRASVEV